MQIPVRLSAAFDSRRSLGVLLALAFASVVLLSTPFLIPEIADAYDVRVRIAAFVGVTQLSGFAFGSWGSGRWLRPTRSVLVGALALAIAVNLGSALLPPLSVLLAFRALSGVSIGVITWFAWSRAFADAKVMSHTAVVGPLIGVVATPLIAMVAEWRGAAGLFVTLAVLPLGAMFFSDSIPTPERRARGERHRATSAARTVLGALTLFSLGGSSVFTFGVVIAGRELGLSAAIASIAYSLNAIVSIPAAGWTRRRGIPSAWMIVTAAAAFLLATSFNEVVFFGSMMLWGFAYWMAIPEVFNVLADASAFPEERAGDAQAMMAVGRVGGPLLGGFLLDGVGNAALGIVGAGLMLSAAAAVFRVRVATARAA